MVTPPSLHKTGQSSASGTRHGSREEGSVPATESRGGRWDKTSCSYLSGFCCDHLGFELLRQSTASAGWMAGVQTLAPLWVHVRKLQGTQQGQEIFPALSSVMREGSHTLADLIQACRLPKAALCCAPPPLLHHHSVTARVLVGDPFPLLM